jgi:N-acyl homoserine lactone hydrolase
MSGSDVRVVPLRLGTMSNAADVMIPGASGRVSYPVPGYVVMHPRGVVVFDTGLHPPLMHSSEELDALANVFTIDMNDDDLLERRLAHVDIDPAAVTHLVNSHLHFDHCGQNAALPEATTIVQRAEWAEANNPPPLSYVGVPLEEVGAGSLHLIDGAHDVFGDGSVVCVPTPGHTPGHQSLLVTSGESAARSSVLLVGDACYFRSMLDDDVTPTYAVDEAGQRASYAVLRQYEHDGAHLVFSHDTTNWDRIPAGLCSDVD